jgi:ribosome maturation factor RimP
MGPAEVVRGLVEPVLIDDGLELVDCELKPGLLRITVDGPDGVDADTLGQTSRRLSRLLDDRDPIEGRYTLEVSTPGLERTLRTPEHFRRAVGALVSIRTHPEADGERRVKGTLTSADDAGIVVTTIEPDGQSSRTIAYPDIERARTVFEWGPQPKPGSKPKTKKAAS